MNGAVLVIDVGTSGTRAAIVRADSAVTHVEYRRTAPDSPFPGLVEFDPVALASVVHELATTVLANGGPVDSVGISTQRGSTVVWDPATGMPVGPGLGWQDLRTIGECINARAEHGLVLAPNQSATKAAWLLAQHADHRGELCFGTIDSWLVWNLTGGEHHVTDHTNAAITGLVEVDGVRWSGSIVGALGLDRLTLPRLVDSSGVVGPASVLPGAPPIAGITGDQQASLVGQGCVVPGRAKCTFGTGGMLDMVTSSGPPRTAGRLEHGTFPIVAWSRHGSLVWGVESIMLTAGTCIDWLVDDLGLLRSAAESDGVAASVPDTDGVVFVPALIGLGTPRWDYGARGTLLGLTRGTTRAHVVRAVLDGIAHRGADLLEAAEADGALSVPSLRVDGGMSANRTFVQLLADATGKPVEVAPYTECTTLGAGYLAGLATGVWHGFDDIDAAWNPAGRVEPRDASEAIRRDTRERWHDAIGRSAGWIPSLSALDF